MLDVLLSSLDTGTYDVGVVMLTTEPTGGASYLTSWGWHAAGTLAAGYLLSTSIAPTLATEARSWFVFEWQNGDADPNPSAGDTLTIVGSG